MNEIRIECEGAISVDISELIPLQGSLKTLEKKPYEKLKKSIIKYGFSFPFFVWKDKDKTLWIEDGHHRKLVIEQMIAEGYFCPPLPICFVHAKDKREAMRKLLAINSRFAKITDDGLYEYLHDADITFADLENEFDLADIDLKKFGAEFFQDDIQEDEIPEPPKDPVTKEGDLWVLGDHLLKCGDSSDKLLVESLFHKKATVVFTDPPYGVSIGKKNAFLNEHQKSERNLDDIASDDLSPEELKIKLMPVFQNIKQIIAADNCSVMVTAPQGGELGLMMMMMRESGLEPRHVLVWKKNSPTFSMGRLDYDYEHEPILFTWGKSHKKVMMGKHRSSVWQIDKPRESKQHPTMKPVELYANAYLNHSDRGDLVAEPFAGSGTAIIAAEQTGRKCYAIELMPKYCDVIIERWQNLTGGNAIRKT